MGRVLNVHVRQDGAWVPLGEIYIPTQVMEQLIERGYDKIQLALDDEDFDRKEKVSKTFTSEEVAEIDRNARAFGWEVGRGAPLTRIVASSPENPFLNKDWDKMMKETPDAS